MARPEFGKFGVWLRDTDYTPELAAALEDLGYGTLWVGGSPDGDLRSVERLLAATSRVTVATGIVNIWKDDPATVGASFRRVEEAYPGRFVLGIGAGHREATAAYDKPYSALQRYLDVLDAEGVPHDRRVLAALGPKTLRLAADRAAGAHPYFTTPNHTRQAREILGTGPLLAPEQKVVLESSLPKARALARASLGFYLGLSNYVANFRRMGFTDDDFADGGSDHLVDSLIAHGTPEAVRDGLTAHLSAGADHVAIQLLVPDGADFLTGYRTLAAALGFPK